MDWNKIKNAPYVRKDDNWFVALCLKMTELMGQPATLRGSLVVLLGVIALFWSMIHFDTLVPMWIFLGVAGVISFLSMIGCSIRDRREAQTHKTKDDDE